VPQPPRDLRTRAPLRRPDRGCWHIIEISSCMNFLRHHMTIPWLQGPRRSLSPRRHELARAGGATYPGAVTAIGRGGRQIEIDMACSMTDRRPRSKMVSVLERERAEARGASPFDAGGEKKKGTGRGSPRCLPPSALEGGRRKGTGWLNVDDPAPWMMRTIPWMMRTIPWMMRTIGAKR